MDGGIDITLTRGRDEAFVQCRHCRGMEVPVEAVRELYARMAAEGASHGYVVTSGRFADDAQDFARGRRIELIDAAKLAALMA